MGIPQIGWMCTVDKVRRDTQTSHDSDVDCLLAQLETYALKGWASGGAKTVQTEVIERLNVSSWASGEIRRSLAITVRYEPRNNYSPHWTLICSSNSLWILRGFYETGIGNHTTALGFYRSAVDILDWGRRVWKNVSVDDGGVIFENSLVRGAKRSLLFGAREVMHTTVYICLLTNLLILCLKALPIARCH